ncbi:alpha/beta fold hydrolase [Tessaracoccus sp. OH4464_COT-324]|uniref:alpha/beta fold hydrolase n=1 Tax=Tessaracoccus sp. OH4464_COT-324 TaxID=2491059 RepID=UPI001319FAEE|nr:alpha/beta hydrolase [Tessaracoccus sp. OH4464_COT-324]
MHKHWRSVEVADTTIQVACYSPTGRAAQRPTAVLVHGLGVSSLYFDPLIEKLAEHAPVVVFDLPGAGRSAETDGVVTIAGFARVLRHILAELDLGETVLLGHSMGTQVVVETLAQEPTVARSAALLAPVVAPELRSAPYLLAAFARTSLHEPLGAVWRAGVGYLQMKPSWLLQQVNAMLAYPMEERIAGVAADLVLLRADNDRVCPRSFLDDLQRRAAGKRVIVRELSNAAHHMMATHADIIVAALLRISGVADAEAEAEAERNRAENA